jgi:hypothetical protein
MSLPIWNRLAAFFRAGSLFTQDSILQVQPELRRLIQGNNFITVGTGSAILDQANVQIHRMSRYRDYEQMDQKGEMNYALDLYADESTVTDPETKHVLSVKAGTRKIRDTVEDFLYSTLNIDRHLRPWVRYLCKYGDLPMEIILNKDRNGVAKLRLIDVYNFIRVETKWGDLVGFFYHDRIRMGEPVFLHPFQVMHARLTHDGGGIDATGGSAYGPYGRSVLEGARKAYKQVRLMEDAALVYRLQRAPERRVFTIPVGNLPTHQIRGFIADIQRSVKKEKFFDAASGDVNERWDPLIMNDDIFLPQRTDGSGPKVDTLPGAQNLGQVADLEFFKKIMMSGVKVPLSRVGLAPPSDGDTKPLAQSSPDFAKAIGWIQREMCAALKKVVMIHLALMGFNEDQLRDFDLFMTSASAMDEMYRMETWQTRADVIDSLMATGLFPARWVLERFTTLTTEEIDEMEEERRLNAALGLDQEGGGGGGGHMGGLGGLGGPSGPPPPMPGEEGVEGGGGMPGPIPGDMPEPVDDESPEEDLGLEWRNPFDESLSKRVLAEDRLFEMRLIRENLRKLYQFRFNGYDYLLNSGEFDGLKVENKAAGKSMLIEGATADDDDRKEREEAKKIACQMLIDDIAALASVDKMTGTIIEGDATTEETITEADIPQA